MSKPTREEVLKWLSITQSGLKGIEYRDVFLKLPDILRVYLAQEEEFKDLREALANQRRTLGKEIDDLFESLTCAQNIAVAEIERLESENKALKASMEADYIERQAKHIQELVKENEALKAFIGNMHVSIATPFFDSKLNREGQP